VKHSVRKPKNSPIMKKLIALTSTIVLGTVLGAVVGLSTSHAAAAKPDCENNICTFFDDEDYCEYSFTETNCDVIYGGQQGCSVWGCY
jgi:hypothetical protein